MELTVCLIVAIGVLVSIVMFSFVVSLRGEVKQLQKEVKGLQFESQRQSSKSVLLPPVAASVLSVPLEEKAPEEKLQDSQKGEKRQAQDPVFVPVFSSAPDFAQEEASPVLDAHGVAQDSLVLSLPEKAVVVALEKGRSLADPLIPEQAQARAFSWEYFLGAKLLAWIGGVFLLIGMLYFVKYSIERDLISPELRVTISFLFALLLGAGGIFIKRRGNEILGQTLSAVGISTAYLSTCAGYLYYHFAFFNWGLTGGLLLGITLFAFYLSSSWRSQVIALLGVMAAFALPFILSRGTGDPVGFFSYILLLNALLWMLIWQCRWGYMLLISSVLTLILSSLWVSSYYQESYQYGVLASCLLFMGGFSGVLLKQVSKMDREKSSWSEKERTQGRVFYGFSVAALFIVFLYLSFVCLILLHCRSFSFYSPVLFWGLGISLLGLIGYLAWKTLAFRYALVFVVLPSYLMLSQAFNKLEATYGGLSILVFMLLWLGYLYYPKRLEQRVGEKGSTFCFEQRGFLKAASLFSLFLTVPCFVEFWQNLVAKSSSPDWIVGTPFASFASLLLLFVALVFIFVGKTGRTVSLLAFYLGFLLVFAQAEKKADGLTLELTLYWAVLALGVVSPFLFWKRLQKREGGVGVLAYEASAGEGRQNVLWGLSGVLLLFAFCLPDSLCLPRTMYLLILGTALAALGGCSALYVRKKEVAEGQPKEGGHRRYGCEKPLSLILYFCFFFVSLNLYLWDVFSGQNVTLLLGLEALLYVAAGFYFSLRSLRLLGIGLLIFCVIKLLSYDLRELSQLYRVASVMGVAVASLLASFFYQKFLKKKFLTHDK